MNKKRLEKAAVEEMLGPLIQQYLQEHDMVLTDDEEAFRRPMHSSKQPKERSQ